MQLCSSLSILWHCLSLGLEWKLTFSSPGATAEFSKFAGVLSAALSQHPLRIWNSSTGIPSPPLALKWCFLRPTWLHIPGCLALGPWSHHRDYLGHEDLSTVCCDVHSERLWYSQQSRSRCFSGLTCFLSDPTKVGNLISGSSAFLKFSLPIWKFSVHILLKLCLKDFEHYLASMWNECKYVVVWTLFGTALL